MIRAAVSFSGLSPSDVRAVPCDQLSNADGRGNEWTLHNLKHACTNLFVSVDGCGSQQRTPGRAAAASAANRDPRGGWA